VAPRALPDPARAIAWALPVAWALLPLTLGDVLADALAPWSDAPAAVAEILAWLGWAAVLTATLVPRPVSLTAVRLGAPLAMVLAVACTPGRSTAAAVVALVHVVLVGALAASPAIGRRAVDGLAYGDEQRVPLRVPTPLWLGPLPLAVAVVGVGTVAGPLLLADERWVAGAIATAVGVPAAVVAARAVHRLSRRWLVLVPAGLVVHDAMTLGDPTLFKRQQLARLSLLPADAHPDPAVVADLRLGTLGGSLVIRLVEPVALPRARRSGPGSAPEVDVVLVAVARPGAVLRVAGSRRLPVSA
jgi:hypothetical protein